MSIDWAISLEKFRWKIEKIVNFLLSPNRPIANVTQKPARINFVKYLAPRAWNFQVLTKSRLNHLTNLLNKICVLTSIIFRHALLFSYSLCSLHFAWPLFQIIQWQERSNRVLIVHFQRDLGATCTGFIYDTAREQRFIQRLKLARFEKLDLKFGWGIKSIFLLFIAVIHITEFIFWFCWKSAFVFFRIKYVLRICFIDS